MLMNRPNRPIDAKAVEKKCLQAGDRGLEHVDRIALS